MNFRSVFLPAGLWTVLTFSFLSALCLNYQDLALNLAFERMEILSLRFICSNLVLQTSTVILLMWTLLQRSGLLELHTKLWMAEDFKACWLSDCVHPQGKLKSPSMHTGPWVKWVTYKCSLVAACVAGIGRANQILVVLKAEEADEWMEVSWQRYKA